MVRSYSENEIATEAGVPHEFVAYLGSIGILPHHEDGGFSFGAVVSTKLVAALLDAGLPQATIEQAAAEGWLNLRNVDDYLPHEPGRRSDRSFGEFQASLGSRGALLPDIYRRLGLPPPDSSLPIHVDEEAMLEQFLEGWQPAREDAPIRAARLVAEGTRVAMLGWADLLDEQIAAPARERLLRGEVNQYPQEASAAFTTLTAVLPQLFTWLGAQYLEQRVIGSIVEALEELLASRDLAPIPAPHAPPAIVFADLSGFTQLIEHRGDETAVVAATSLQLHADEAAARYRGRLVKLLGDGALLRFPDPGSGVAAAIDLVATMGREEAIVGHAGVDAGPVIERDLDVFGRTVNLASRIADVAEPGDVLVSDRVAGAAADKSFAFERVDPRVLKGIAEPVLLYRAIRIDQR